MVSFFFLMSLMLINFVIVGFVYGIGVSSVFVGMIVGLMNLILLVFWLFVGNLIDWVFKYCLIFVGGCLLLLVSLGYSLIINVMLIMLLWILNGLGYILCLVCMVIWMVSLLLFDWIGFGMGIYGLVNVFGMVCGLVISVFLY